MNLLKKSHTDSELKITNLGKKLGEQKDKFDKDIAKNDKALSSIQNTGSA